MIYLSKETKGFNTQKNCEIPFAALLFFFFAGKAFPLLLLISPLCIKLR